MASQNSSASCVSCGLLLPEGARFCPQCGTPVAAPAPRGERRHVTVLFADLSGYTHLSSQLDPEVVHQILGRYFDLVDAAIRNYGGVIDKHIGDAVMGVFGAPVAHGNEPERAVRAALDIHAGLSRLSQEMGRDLAVHIGIASGEVVAADTGSAAHHEYTVTGDAVNLAARLDDLAQAGETFISGAVHRAVMYLVDAQAKGEVEVKGIDKPVAAWKLTSLCTHRSRGRAMVGREAERQRLAATLDETSKTNIGAVVQIRGDAGIGKSRLVDDLCDRAAEKGFVHHDTWVLDFGTSKGRDAAGLLVRSLLETAPDADASKRLAAIERTRAAHMLTDDELVFAYDLLDLAMPEALRAMHSAMDNAARARGRDALVAALAVRAAAAQPQLVVVEDVHWADQVVLAGLAMLAAATKRAAIVLVLTARPDSAPIDATWSAAADNPVQHLIELAPLAPAEANDLAHEFALSNSEQLGRCVARAGGNPLFLLQLLQNVMEGAESIPGSVQSLVLARMDRLATDDRTALQAAAVIGQRFEPDALRHMLGNASYDCDVLVTHRLLTPEGAGFRFVHALVQEGVYSSLLNTAKRDLHRRAAEWFARADLALCAEHLDRAEDAAAARAYFDAAREQIQGYRLESALALAQRGVALAHEAADRYALAMLLGELLLELGRAQESIAMHQHAVEVAIDDADRCRAQIGIAAGHRIIGGADAALAALALAEPIAARMNLTSEQSKIRHTRGNLYFARGNIAGCLAEHEMALAFARQARNAEAEANALSGLGDASYAQGRMRSGFEFFRQCVELSRTHGLVRTEIPNRCMMGHTRTFLMELDAALDNMLESKQLATRVGQAHAQMFSEFSLAAIYLHRGDYDESVQTADRSLAMAQLIGSKRYESFLLLTRSLALAAQGEHELARVAVDQALALCRLTGMGFLGPAALAGQALTSRDGVERKAALQEGERLLADQPVSHCYFWFYRDAIDVALDMGDWAEAERYATALEDFVSNEPLPWARYYAERARVLAAFARGEQTPHWREAAQRLQQEAQRTRLLYGSQALERVLAADWMPSSSAAS